MSGSQGRPTLLVLGLTKRYAPGAPPAVDAVDLLAHRGQTLGLLGPNGAGKSTTIGVCTTRIRACAGRVRVAGWDVARDGLAARRHMGVVTQHNTLDRSCTVYENLYLHCRFFGMPRRVARQRTDALLDLFALGARAGHKPAWLSGGLIQRVQVARAIAHEPAVLFLDEPTAGLDPQSRLALWDHLGSLRAAGTTIILTTHYLEEAERLCDRIAVMDKGRILACETPATLVHAAGRRTRVVLSVARPTPSVHAELEALSDVISVEPHPEGYLLFSDGGQQALASILAVAAAAGVTGLQVATPSLEDVFIAMTGRQLRD